MSFHEIRLSENISYGSSGGPGFSTSVIETESGHEQRVARWSRARRTYDISNAIRSLEEIREVTEFFMARQGALHGFRFKDPFDFTSAANGKSTPETSDQLIGTGDNSQKVFQLTKRYVSGSQTIVRSIQKPVAGTVVVEVDSVTLTPTTEYTVDTTTGVVTLVSAPGIGLEIKAGFEFDVPVRFSSDIDKKLDAVYDAFNSGSISSLPLVEIPDLRQIEDDYFLGGASTWETSVLENPVLLGQGKFQEIDVTDATHDVVLPDPTYLPLGGPYFYLSNVGAYTSEILDENSATVSPFASNSKYIIMLGVSGWTVI